MENILSLAKKMADDMPDSEKEKLQNMDFNSVFGSIYQNIIKQMDGVEGFPGGIESMKKELDKGLSSIRFDEKESDDSDDDPDDIISQKSRDLHYNLNVKLDDLYNGKQKKISFFRKRYKEIKDPKTKKIKYEQFDEKKKIIINIVPGMSDGDNIIFEGESDQLPGEKPGDVVITICEDDHDIFDRENDNLFLVKDVSLSELYSTDFSLTHMDGRVLRIKSKDGDYLHTNDGIRKIKGEGMPIQNESTKGDLFIRFNLILPDKLDEDKVNVLKTIAPPFNKVSDEKVDQEYDLDIVTEEDMEKLENSDEDSDENSDEDEDSDENSDENSDEDSDEDSDSKLEIINE